MLDGDAAAGSALEVPTGDTFAWDAKSTYVASRRSSTTCPARAGPLTDITGARVLALLGDSVTTDHISPAGNIAKGSPAAKYLDEHGVKPARLQLSTARAAATTR